MAINKQVSAGGNGGFSVVTTTTKKASIGGAAANNNGNMGAAVMTVGGSNKVAKSVSQSKPPAHFQYFNSAKIKNDTNVISAAGVTGP